MTSLDAVACLKDVVVHGFDVAPVFRVDPRNATLVRVSDPTSEAEFNEADEIAYLRAAPAEAILGNHLFVLLQVAALRLGETPPNLAAAELVIDTVAAMVNAGGARLGEHVDLYRSALAEVQQAYVRAKSTPTT